MKAGSVLKTLVVLELCRTDASYCQHDLSIWVILIKLIDPEIKVEFPGGIYSENHSKM